MVPLRRHAQRDRRFSTSRLWGRFHCLDVSCRSAQVTRFGEPSRGAVRISCRIGSLAVGRAGTKLSSLPVRSVHRFILRAFDPVLGCPVLEAMLQVADLDRLRSLLGDDASDDAALERNYEINSAQLKAIAEGFGVVFDSGGRECWLSRARSIRDVPYLVHTGYELALMLDGIKPFAKFIVEYPVQPDDFSEDALFEPHVQSGLLIRRIMEDEPFEKPIRSASGRIYNGVRRIYYARRGEEWRIDAHILVWRQLDHGPWNETLERLEGSLLGYTDAQNDWWLARRRRDHATAIRTDRTAFVAVDAAELAWIRSVGDRAFQPERAGSNLELVMHWPLPEPAMLEAWLTATGAAAITRVGLSGKFLDNLEFGQRNGHRSYLIRPDEVLALNRALTSSIEVVIERPENPFAK